MGMIISASIDLAKIDKSQIFEKDGKKWLNVQVSVNDEVNQWGQNVSISINQSKEQREAKEPKVYLGNGAVKWSDGKVINAVGVAPTPTQSTQTLPDTNLPF